MHAVSSELLPLLQLLATATHPWQRHYHNSESPFFPSFLALSLFGTYTAAICCFIVACFHFIQKVGDCFVVAMVT
ncbi:unnamed protein product [Gongylonema pulchrum]|uniref:Secreted protein n=1 Tax=Gongylonema pulchrum TaxID=637853 RepID=A0A183ED40_9BILA|nr:unnamed protein product [Gongylonema pulchrum]